MSQASAIAINDILSSNPSIFKVGSIITSAQWRLLFQPVHKLPRSTKTQPNALKYVTSYGQVNRILRKRGLYVTSKNYYSEFHILGGTARIAQYTTGMKKHADNILKAADELRRSTPKVAKRYSFKTLSTTEIATVGRYIDNPILTRR